MSRRLAFLVLGRAGIGEAIIAMSSLRSAVSAGFECLTIVHNSCAGVFRDCGSNIVEASDGLGPLLEFFIEEHVRNFRPSDLILCDFFTTDASFRFWKIDPGFLARLDCKVIAIDVWQLHRSPRQIDMYINRLKPGPDWSMLLHSAIVPVPIASPVVDEYAFCYLQSEKQDRPPRKIRLHVRNCLSIPAGHRVIVLTTSKWQHIATTDLDGQRIMRVIPKLLGWHFSSLEPGVTVIHVGGAPFDHFHPLSDSQYRWLPALPSSDFQRLLGCADLYMTLNLSATTIMQAMRMDIPVAVFVNGYSIPTAADYPFQRVDNFPLESDVFPIYRFLMWPLGFHRLISDLLHCNPYPQALTMLEILDPDSPRRIGALLEDGESRVSALRQQDTYLGQVVRLPKFAEVLAQVS